MSIVAPHLPHHTLWTMGYHDGMSSEATPTPKISQNPEEAFEKALTEFESRVGVTFSDRNLLKRVFTRETFVVGSGTGDHNESLEYEGDKLLLEILKDIFPMVTSRTPKLLSRNAVLSRVAMDLKMNLCLQIARPEAELRSWRGQTKILADTVEAYLYALNLDQGRKAAERFVNKFICPLKEEMEDLFLRKGALRKKLKQSLDEVPNSPPAQMRELNENPWIFWGLQGEAHPHYPLKTDMLAVDEEPDYSQWRVIQVERRYYLPHTNMWRFIQEAKERNVSFEFKRGSKQLNGKYPAALFVQGVLVWSQRNDKLNRIAHSARRRLADVDWDVSKLRPWKYATETPDESGESDSDWTGFKETT